MKIGGLLLQAGQHSPSDDEGDAGLDGRILPKDNNGCLDWQLGAILILRNSDDCLPDDAAVFHELQRAFEIGM